MFSDDVRKKLENIVQGTVVQEQGDTCTSIRNLLCNSFSTSATVKKDFESKSIIKEKQVRFLKRLASENNYWFHDLPDETCYLARGGEAKVYLHVDCRHVIKFNDGIYYATWLEYFNSVVIHNLIFPQTAYEFLGFVEREGVFYVILKQPFIIADGIADLSAIRQLLEFNGFKNTRRQDYYNQEMGLILEDMHDENVIQNENVLFFIDTVFYVVKPANEYQLLYPKPN